MEVSLNNGFDGTDIEGTIIFGFGARLLEKCDLDTALLMAGELEKRGGEAQAVSEVVFFDVIIPYIKQLAFERTGYDPIAADVGIGREFACLMEGLIDCMEWLGNDKAELLKTVKARCPKAEWTASYHPPWRAAEL